MRWVERLEEGALALLLAAMTLVTFVQVVARYVFDYSFTWALELTTILFAWMIFIGIPYGVRVGVHIGVDVLVKSVGPRTARVAPPARFHSYLLQLPRACRQSGPATHRGLLHQRSRYHSHQQPCKASRS